MNTAATAQPRALGSARVRVRAAGGRSRLADLHQSGASRLVFPRKGDRVEAALVNIAGGITGGDRFDLTAEAEEGAHLTLTTQSCERIYRAQPGSTGRLSTTLNVAPGARINWLPQETILFDGSDFKRALSVDVAPGGSALISEAVILGRAAMGERLGAARFADRIDLRHGGRLVLAERLRLDGDIAATMANPFTGDGAGAYGTVILCSEDAGRVLGSVRNLALPGLAATLVDPCCLVVRLLAADGMALRASLIPLLETAGDVPLPTVWRL